MVGWNFIFYEAKVQELKQTKFDCSCLLNEVEMVYHELRDILGLPFQLTNQKLMRHILIFSLEDSLNKFTDPRFRETTELTLNLLTNYFNETEKLDDVDIEDIEDFFIKPILSETSSVIGKLYQHFDRYYSKWSIDDTAFPFITISYLGDYRIDEWHLIHDIPSKEPVVVKQHRIRYIDVSTTIIENIKHVQDIAVSDISTLVEKIVSYYTGGQIEELYNDIVGYLSVINNCTRDNISHRAHRQARSIIKDLEDQPVFKRLMDDLKIAELIYSSQSKRHIIFDCILPSKDSARIEMRKKILEEIEEKGYIENDVSGKIEVIYG